MVQNRGCYLGGLLNGRILSEGKRYPITDECA
jgi:hypothetical protein